MDSNASNAGASRRAFTPEFKLKVVLECMQRDTTVEQVRRKYNVSWSVIDRWRKEFKAKAPEIFGDQRNPRVKAKTQGYAPGQSPDELKRIIGDLTIQVEVLKKVEGLLP
jgi:transposase